MKIALVAATGQIGRHIAQRAHQRGHAVTALVRRTLELPPELDGVRTTVAALDDPQRLAEAVRGHDVLASAYGPGQGDPGTLVAVAHALVTAARAAGVKRLVVVGGAGSLLIAPGLQLVDSPDFPAAYKGQALAHRAALAVYRAASDLDWTFLAPAGQIGPGARRGHFRTQADAFLTDTDGHSQIHYGDYADAFVEVIEQAHYVRQLATAAY
ncbi:NAD(P)-dependent oxidoreductase [Dyella sp.]|uniref:NAD(P)-dependent oxidoreductase n=1 Tax=Dyella sp. TaxID=1869338 RepID=UPI002D786AC6|nr:NAD(P)H-binding protein [Dyella sp.]HET6432263.1 NAD(P)H-binding protein [Dyella sp.]